MLPKKEIVLLSILSSFSLSLMASEENCQDFQEGPMAQIEETNEIKDVEDVPEKPAESLPDDSLTAEQREKLNQYIEEKKRQEELLAQRQDEEMKELLAELAERKEREIAKKKEEIEHWRNKLIHAIKNGQHMMVHTLTTKNHAYLNDPLSDTDDRTLLMLAVEQIHEQTLTIVDLLLDHIDPKAVPGFPGMTILDYYLSILKERNKGMSSEQIEGLIAVDPLVDLIITPRVGTPRRAGSGSTTPLTSTTASTTTAPNSGTTLVNAVVKSKGTSQESETKESKDEKEKTEKKSKSPKKGYHLNLGSILASSGSSSSHSVNNSPTAENKKSPKRESPNKSPSDSPKSDRSETESPKQKKKGRTLSLSRSRSANSKSKSKLDNTPHSSDSERNLLSPTISPTIIVNNAANNSTTTTTTTTSSSTTLTNPLENSENENKNNRKPLYRSRTVSGASSQGHSNQF